MPAPLYLTHWAPYENGRPMPGAVEPVQHASRSEAVRYLGDKIVDGKGSEPPDYLGCTMTMFTAMGPEPRAVSILREAHERARQIENDARDLMRQRPSWSTMHEGVR